MLLTITPNPPIDRILHVPQMTVGAVHRTTDMRLAAGGKGLNTARAAHRLGCKVLATGPLAGQSGKVFAGLTEAEGLPADWHWLSRGESRTCMLITHDTGDATVINEQGPTVSAADWADFARHVTGLARQAQAVAFAGSLPLGVDPEALGKLARSLVAAGRAVYMDTSRAALAAVLAKPEGLWVKVNQLELATGLGLEPGDRPIAQLVEAGQILLDRGAASVVVTLGSAGALAVSHEGAWQATPPPIELVSSVGSGDSMLAGLAVAQLEGQSIDAALAFGVACGSANALNNLPGRFERSEAEALLARTRVGRL